MQIVITLATFGIIALFHSVTDDSVVTVESKVNSSQSEERSSEITLSAVGDILIHNTVYQDARTSSGYDFRPIVQSVQSELKEADITFANQEGPIAGKALGLSGYPRFNAPKAVSDILADSGVDVVNFANNHTLDRNAAGVQTSIQHFKSAGLTYIGANTSPKDAKRIRTISKNDITASFLGYTYGTNGIPIPKNKSYLVNTIDLTQIKRDIHRAKKLSDIVVVSLHFGTQYQTKPNQKQKTLAKDLSEAGADIILGHHPHVLQPVTQISSKDQNTLVAYSLGNFISGQVGIRRNIGGILDVTVKKDHSTDTISFENVSFMPTWTHHPNQQQFRVVPLKNATPSFDANEWYTRINAHVKQYK